MRTLRVVCAALVLVGLSSAHTVADERVVIELEDGSKVEGEILKKDEAVVHLSVGDQVLSLERVQIASITTLAGQEQGPKVVQEFTLYRTASLPERAVSTLSEQLGPAIVTVKTPAGMGTGWFCTPDGYVVTNNHVVGGERSITVTAFERQQGRFEKKVYKKVKLVALDAHMDLALLKIEEAIEMDVPQLYLGDSSELKEGDEVFTIGNPMGLERSMAQGIISKINRSFAGRLYLQTTAPIAPGNSGGPLFNNRGEVVGVTNMGYIFLDGLGFAIPSKYVKEFLDNVEAFAYDPDNPNTGIKYMETPISSTDGALTFDDCAFVKTGHGLSCLTVADINGDEVDEVVFVNNNKGEIGVLRLRGEEKAEPEPRDFEDINRLPQNERFTLDTHAVHNKISSIVVEDMNHDGRPDILFHGDIDGLAVLEQDEDGGFASPRRIADVGVAERSDALRVADFDGDGTKEIFALGRKAVSLLHEPDEPKVFPLNASYRDKITEYDLLDVNCDGRLDVVFFVADKFFAARVLLQNSEGGFVEEELVSSHLSGPVQAYHADLPGETAGEAAPGQHRFLTLDKGQNRVRSLVIAECRQPSREGRLNVSIQAMPLDAEAGTSGDCELADLNGDGTLEVLTVNKAKHEFVIFETTAHGVRAHRFPSPKGMSDLKLYQRTDGRAVLFSVSDDENIFGISRADIDGVTFPRPINTESRVQFLWLGEVDGEQTVVWVEKSDRKSYVVRATSVEALSDKAFETEKGSIDVEAGTLLFGADEENLQPRLPNTPASLAFADFNGDGTADLVVYWAYSKKESLYLGLGEGRYRSIIADQEFLKQQEGQPLLTADIDGDGKDDVLLAQPDFVRVLRVDDKGKLYTERQFNWRFQEVRRLVPCGGGDVPRFVALTEDMARIVEFDLERSQFKSVATVDLAGLESGELNVADVDGNGAPDLLIMGRNALQVIYCKDSRRELQSRIVFDAKLDYFTYWNLRTADLDGDQRDEVLLFDSKKAMFEIHRLAEDGKLRPIFRQRLFEKSIQQRDETDSNELPQEMAVGDVDNNGTADLVFNLQDRVAVYLQKAPEPMHADAVE